MSSDPGGDSVGMVLRMVYNSSRRDAVCCSLDLISFSGSSDRSEAPFVRIAEVIMRVLELSGWVIVWIALGVGGTKPPMIPVICCQFSLFHPWISEQYRVDILCRTLQLALQYVIARRKCWQVDTRLCTFPKNRND